MDRFRKCCVCEEVKPIGEYFPYPRNKSGIMAACKKCHVARTMRANHKNMEKRRAQRRRYNETPERRVAAYENTKKMYNLYPEKQRARMRVYHAIKTGKITKMPCSVCGDEKVQGHHSDYTKPLEVIWLCVTHHKELHVKMLASI